MSEPDEFTTNPLLEQVWIAVGVPGFAGAEKARRQQLLDQRFGANGWRYGHYVRGEIVSPAVAILEYEESYRRFLRRNPQLVEFLVTVCGNVYDWGVANVHDDTYEQPHTEMNHYQDISVRRVIAELVDDPTWPTVTTTTAEDVDLHDLGTGESHRVPRAHGFRGNGLLQIRDSMSPGYCLNPAVVPAHDPALLVSAPGHEGWFLEEGCSHLSVEAFWQMSKVIEVRYDRFLALGDDRARPLEGL
ncbi:MAG: hypothetical protein K8R99_02505 [Actinomycetia bacterium]|nr:hypothetical protein [Actinomycetes bacterium]